MFPNILSSSPLGQIDGAYEHPAYHQGHTNCSIRKNARNSPPDLLTWLDGTRQYRDMMRTCPYCGAKFYPVVPNQRFCTRTHSQMAYLRRKKGLPERRTVVRARRS